MVDPEKIGKTQDPLLRQLIAAGRSEVPGHETVRRMLAGAGISGALVAVNSAKAAGGAGLAAAATGASASLVIVKWTLIGVIAGALSSGGASVLMTSREPADPAPKPLVAPVWGGRVADGVPEPLGTVSDLPPPAPGREARTEPVTPLPAVRGSERPAAHAARAVANPQSAELGKEALLVDVARAALARGDFAMVLRLTDEHSARFPRAQLGDAIAYLRMEALERGGHPDEARRAAESLLEANPSSPHTSRARAVAGTGH
jgi:hypothetical protein